MSENGNEHAWSIACITRTYDSTFTGQLEIWSPDQLVRKHLNNTEDVDNTIQRVVNRGYELFQVDRDISTEHMWFKARAERQSKPDDQPGIW